MRREVERERCPRRSASLARRAAMVCWLAALFATVLTASAAQSAGADRSHAASGISNAALPVWRLWPSPPSSTPVPAVADSAGLVQGWSVEPAKLEGVGASPAAIVLGRYVLVMGGVTPSAAKKASTEGGATAATAALAKGLTAASARRSGGSVGDGGEMLSFASFIEEHTTRTVNLFDLGSGTVRLAKDAASPSTADDNMEETRRQQAAMLRQPAVGASSVVRVGPSVFALGLCNTIPPFVDVAGLSGSSARSRREREHVKEYLLSIQEIRLADLTSEDAPATKRGDAQDDAVPLHFASHALPSTTTLRFNATCVASSASATSEPADAVSRRIIYIVGGVNLLTGEGIPTVAQYDVDTGSFVDAVWSLDRPLATPGVVAQSELLFITGGYRQALTNKTNQNGVPLRDLVPFNQLSVLDLSRRAFRSDVEPFGPVRTEHGETVNRSSLVALGWTAPQVFTHGRTMVIAGVRGDSSDAYSSLLVWADMTGSDGGTPVMSSQASHSGSATVMARERSFMKLHTGLLAPQRRDATLVAVPADGALRLFLLGGAMPAASATAAGGEGGWQVSNDIFSATVATSDETAAVAMLGVSVATTPTQDGDEGNRTDPAVNVSSAPREGDSSSSSTSRSPDGDVAYRALGDASAMVLGYDVIAYNTSFRVLLSPNLSRVCPGIEGSDNDQQEVSSQCSLLLSTSPNCEAPVAVFQGLGPHNVRRVNVTRRAQATGGGGSWSVWRSIMGVARTADSDAAQHISAFSVGDVYLTGSRATGPLLSHFTDGADGSLAFKRFPPTPPLPSTAAASPTSQHHLYVCLSPRAGTVMGCDSQDSDDGNNSGKTEGDNHGREDSGNPFLNVWPAGLSRGVDPSPPEHQRDAAAVTGDSSRGRLERAGRLSPLRPPHPFVPKRTTFCQSSFYVVLNGPSPFLLRDTVAANEKDAQADQSGQPSISLRFCLIGAALMSLTTFAAVYVYRERYGNDPDYAFACTDRHADGFDREDEDDGGQGGGGRPTSFRGSFSQLRALRPGGRRGSNRSWLSKLLDKLASSSPNDTSTGNPLITVVTEEGHGQQEEHLLASPAQQRRRRHGAAESHPPRLAATTQQQQLRLRRGSPPPPSPPPPSTMADNRAAAPTTVADPSAPEASATARGATDAEPKQRKKSILDGKYKVLRRLGRGSFSVVYLVKRVSDGKKLALKYVQCSDDMDRREAMKECEVAYALQGHPNVIELVDMFLSYKFDSHLRGGTSVEEATSGGAIVVQRVESSSGSDGDAAEARRQAPRPPHRGFLQGERYLSLVMAYHEEGDLGQWVRAHKQSHPHERIPEMTVVSIAFQVLSALQFMHQRDPPIVHRDLKPENLLLTRKIHYPNAGKSFLPIVLTDFGLSRIMDKTFCETGVGSLPYVAPECWRRRYSCKVDIWALGCILYAVMSKRVEADTVRVMFSESAQPDFHAKLMTELTDGLGYSERLARLVVRLLEVEPKERPTAEEALHFISAREGDGSVSGGGAAADGLLPLFDVRPASSDAPQTASDSPAAPHYGSTAAVTGRKAVADVAAVAASGVEDRSDGPATATEGETSGVPSEHSLIAHPTREEEAVRAMEPCVAMVQF